MEFWLSLLSLAALAGFAVLLVRRGWLEAPLAPFAALCGTMLWFALGGMLGVLRAAGWLYFALAALAWVLSAYGKNPVGWQALRAPGFAAFWTLSVLLMLFFAWRQPMFTTWDEFSFWGTAAKIVKYSNGLYVNAAIGWDWVGTHRPALIVLGYFFQFFGRYAEWRVLAGYDVLLLSIFTLLTAGAERGEYRRWVPAMAFGFLLPYLLTLYGTAAVNTDLYVSSLSDVPLGLTFGAALAVYYASPRRALWPAALALAALCLEKDTGFALALIAAGIIALDAAVQAAQAHCLPRTLAKLAGVFAACGAAFWSWQQYLAAASRADVSNVGGTEQMGMAQMVLTGLRELAGIGRTGKFAAIMGNMVHTLLHVKNTMLGPGIVTAALALALVLGAAALSRSRAVRLRCAAFALLSLAGFAAYFCFIGFTYVYVFTTAISDTLVGYERYIFPYLLGWLLAAAALALSVRGEAAPRRDALLTGGFGALTLALAALVLLRVPLTLTFLGASSGIYAGRRATAAEAAEVQAAVPRSAHIFFVSQGDDGNRWFRYTYELYPWYLDYSGTSRMGGGGTFALPGALAADTLYYHPYTPEALLACIRGSGCDYVFIERSDELFSAGYAQLFSDGLSHVEEGGAVYAYNAADGQFDYVCSVGVNA